MKLAPLASLVCVLSLSQSSAFAQTSSGLSALPSAPFQFTGAWDCQGAFGNGKHHHATFTAQVILGGKWLQLNETDVEPATGYLAQYLIGFDPQAKRLLEFDANNFGAATYSSDQGWVAGVLTMTSPVTTAPQQPYAANRFVYAVTANDTFGIDWQISRSANLTWVTSDHLVCKRT